MPPLVLVEGQTDTLGEAASPLPGSLCVSPKTGSGPPTPEAFPLQPGGFNLASSEEVVSSTGAQALCPGQQNQDLGGWGPPPVFSAAPRRVFCAARTERARAHWLARSPVCPRSVSPRPHAPRAGRPRGRPECDFLPVRLLIWTASFRSSVCLRSPPCTKSH